MCWIEAQTDNLRVWIYDRGCSLDPALLQHPQRHQKKSYSRQKPTEQLAEPADDFLHRQG